MATSEKQGPIQWHPISGCSKIDKDCVGCWARGPAIKNTVEINLPLSWEYRHFVHVGNYSDIFLKEYSDNYILKIFQVMNDTPLSEFMVQTKNSDRMVKLSNKIRWTDNIWMGVTVTNNHNMDRIDHLRSTGAKIKWIGFTPLKKKFKHLNFDGIDWVVVGPALYSKTPIVYDDRKITIIDECNRLNIPYYDRNRFETRSFNDYSDSSRFPKDLEAQGVLYNQKFTCTLIYCKPSGRSIKGRIFKGSIIRILPDLKQFIDENPDLIFIGVTPVSNFNRVMEVALKEIAKSKKVEMLTIVDELVVYLKRFNYDSKNQIASIASLANPNDRFNQFDKFQQVMRFFYEKFIGSIIW